MLPPAAALMPGTERHRWLRALWRFGNVSTEHPLELIQYLDTFGKIVVVEIIVKWVATMHQESLHGLSCPGEMTCCDHFAAVSICCPQPSWFFHHARPSAYSLLGSTKIGYPYVRTKVWRLTKNQLGHIK